ncbi:MAG: hypothetical protein AB4042_19060 [Leptolyngbyaceae cyanobacterium]
MKWLRSLGSRVARSLPQSMLETRSPSFTLSSHSGKIQENFCDLHG